MSATEHVSTEFTTTRLSEGYESEVDNDPADNAIDAASANRPTLVAPSTSGTIDGSGAAARLLEIAVVNADELLTEAKSEAAATVASAHAEAEQITGGIIAEADQVAAAARAEAEQVTTAAHTEAETVRARLEEHRVQQTAELNRHRTTVMSELAERKAGLEAEVNRLQQQERDHRDRMRSYFAEQLEQLDPGTPATSSDDVD